DARFRAREPPPMPWRFARLLARLLPAGSAHASIVPEASVLQPTPSQYNAWTRILPGRKSARCWDGLMPRELELHAGSARDVPDRRRNGPVTASAQRLVGVWSRGRERRHPSRLHLKGP